MERNKQSQPVNIINILKFVICTILGIVIVLIPFSFSNGVDTVLFHYLKLVVQALYTPIQVLIILAFVISALLATYDMIAKPAWIRENPTLKNLFSTTPFYLFNRIMGAVISLLCFFKFGPQVITSMETGGAMLDLATQLSVLIPIMLLLQTLILEFGAMEFIGELVGFIMRPLFKMSEMTAVSAISAWVGPGNAAILGTKELFEKGYFTVKEVAAIGSQFAISSVGWVVLVCSVLDVMDKFGMIFLGITLIGMIVAAISVRIPPISKYPDVYVDGSTERHVEVDQSQSKWQRAIGNACLRASQVTAQNFISKKDNMMFYVLWLMPIIVFWGTIALAISVYTPLLGWVSYPVELVLNLFNVAESNITASAIMSGFADNYLPVILGSKVTSAESRTIIAMMSILQLIFMSEIATLLKSTGALKNFKDILIIFLLRTFISLPFVILFVKIILF
ncbi:arginine transporter [Staphylococcus sp. H16/1A]|uniref:Arginine transporter n=2 Tax=Staphylococcus canis TaxID=2724942 RepID=A0ABS0TA86_9STAP|nr:arginine transporter [Staphylococcus canis]